MNRGIFIKRSTILGIAALTDAGTRLLAGNIKPKHSFSGYRGFNLLAKFSGRGPVSGIAHLDIVQSTKGYKLDRKMFELLK